MFNYIFENDELKIKIPLSGSGKARTKRRNSLNDYGKSFSPSSIPMDDKTYIEWQIGYDVILKDISKKPTSLTNWIFVGANKKEKHLYELSEILWLLSINGIISENELKTLKKEIDENEYFLISDYQISLKNKTNINLMDEEFISYDIVLPTFYKTYNHTLMDIEISIQKQQYASGIQPMLYLCIPILELKNYNEVVNNTTKKVKYGELIINRNNKNIILDIFKFFGICSKNHKHDILEILKIIIDNMN